MMTFSRSYAPRCGSRGTRARGNQKGSSNRDWVKARAKINTGRMPAET